MHFKTALITIIFLFNTLMGTGFRIGTLVHTPEGLIAIEKITSKTFVYCSDADTISIQKVIQKRFTLEKNCLAIVLDNHEKIVVSQYQEFYNPIEQIWKKAHDLTAHDTLLRANGTHATIEGIIHLPQRVLLCDLSVENCHNYFVSSQALLVHNFEPVSFGIFFTILIGSGGIEVSSIGAAIYVAGIALGIKGLMNNKQPIESISNNDVQFSHPNYPECYYEIAAPKTNGISIEPILKAAPPCYKTKQDTSDSDNNAQQTAQEEAVALQTTKPVDPPKIGPGCGEIKPEELPIHTGGHIKPEQPTRIPGCGQQELPPTIIHTGDTNPPVIQGPLVLFTDGIDVTIPKQQPLVINEENAEQNKLKEKLSFKMPSRCTPELEAVLKKTTLEKATGGKSTIFAKDADFQQALKDFESLNPSHVSTTENGLVGTLSDGKTANVRTMSTDKRPTLEIRNPINNKRIKIRYTKGI